LGCKGVSRWHNAEIHRESREYLANTSGRDDFDKDPYGPGDKSGYKYCEIRSL